MEPLQLAGAVHWRSEAEVKALSGDAVVKPPRSDAAVKPPRTDAVVQHRSSDARAKHRYETGYATSGAIASHRPLSIDGDSASGAHLSDAIGDSGPTERWYRSPIVWLAIVLFVASLVGCIVTIVLALGQPADALPDAGEALFRVPLAGIDALRAPPLS